MGTYNPATGRKEFVMISTAMEVSMGQNIHQQILKEFGLSKDTVKIARLQRVGKKLAAISDRQDYDYKFYLIDKKELNAFTVPGGGIYFFAGLYDKLKTDDEIAGVLAHEIGHCSAKHTVKKFQAAMGYNLIQALVLSQMGESSRQLSAQASDMAMNLVFSAYSRGDEYQADVLGVKYMYLAGYDLNGMIATFQTLKKESEGPNVPLFLRSHPYLDDRVKAVEIEIQKAPEKYGRR
jgi:predicted Zn-dependent protease